MGPLPPPAPASGCGWPRLQGREERRGQGPQEKIRCRVTATATPPGGGPCRAGARERARAGQAAVRCAPAAAQIRQQPLAPLTCVLQAARNRVSIRHISLALASERLEQGFAHPAAARLKCRGSAVQAWLPEVRARARLWSACCVCEVVSEPPSACAAGASLTHQQAEQRMLRMP